MTFTKSASGVFTMTGCIRVLITAPTFMSPAYVGRHSFDANPGSYFLATRVCLHKDSGLITWENERLERPCKFWCRYEGVRVFYKR